MRHDTAKEFQEESTQEAGIFFILFHCCSKKQKKEKRLKLFEREA